MQNCHIYLHMCIISQPISVGFEHRFNGCWISPPIQPQLPLQVLVGGGGHSSSLGFREKDSQTSCSV